MANDYVYVTRESDGAVQRWDWHAIVGRGLSNGYRLATKAEIAAFERNETVSDRLDAIERRIAELARAISALRGGVEE